MPESPFDDLITAAVNFGRSLAEHESACDWMHQMSAQLEAEVKKLTPPEQVN